MADAQDLEALSRGYFTALLGRNSPALDLLLASDFWLIEPLMGWKVSRSTLLNDLGSGGLSFQELDVTGIQVRTYDNTGIVIGRMQMKGRLGDSDFSLACRYTQVYVRSRDRWQLVSAQETPIETWGKGADETGMGPKTHGEKTE